MIDTSARKTDASDPPPLPAASPRSQAFRREVLADGSERVLFLGEWAALRFEPPHGGLQRSNATGLLLCARLLLAEHADDAGWPAAPALAGGVYAEIEGLGRVYAGTGSGDASGRAWDLRFSLQAPQIEALRAGADFGFGIEHAQLRVGAMVKRTLRASLLDAS